MTTEREQRWIAYFQQREGQFRHYKHTREYLGENFTAMRHGVATCYMYKNKWAVRFSTDNINIFDLNQIVNVEEIFYCVEHNFPYKYIADAIRANDYETTKAMIEANCMHYDYNFWDHKHNDDLLGKLACESGHLDIVKCLKEHEIKWKYSTYAAEHGHLHILKYMHENGVRFSHFLFSFAKKIEIFDWLIVVGYEPYPVDRRIDESYHVCGHTTPEMLRWLLQHGLRFTEHFLVQVVENPAVNPNYVVRLVHNHGCPMYLEAYKCTVREKDWNLAEFILRKHIESRDDVQALFSSEHFEGDKLLNFIHTQEFFWRNCLFKLDLTRHEKLNEHIQKKKKYIEDVCNICSETLEKEVLKDVLKFCLHPFI
jgi:hypothetical protein